MISKYRPIACFLAVVICMSLMFSFVGCEDDSDEVKLTYRGPENYSYPGGTTLLYVNCEPEYSIPLKPVFVWRVSFNQNMIEEIVHDSEPKTDKKDEYSGGSLSDSKYEWPNYDELHYTCTNEGKYTFNVSLYDYDEYKKNKSTAEILASYTHTVYCEKIKVSVKASPTENDREYSLKATVENPKFIPYLEPPKWQFINNKTGITDNGKTEQITFDNDLYDSGRHEVVHQFEQSGEYKVIFSITSKHDGSQIASTQTIVDVSRAFQIIAPAKPLETGQEYAFTVRTDSPESLTESPSYEWDFGDGSGIIVPFSNEVNHVFNKEGTYVIYLEVFESDEEAANTLGSAYLEVEVEASANVDFLDSLRQTNWIEIGLVCPITTQYGSRDAWISEWAKDNSLGIVQWEGSHFSVTWSSERHSEIISGDVRQEGSDLYISLKARHEFDKDTDIAFWEIEISELPLSTYKLVEYGEFRFEGRKFDSDVPQYVTYFNTNDLESVDWSSELSLSVVFDRKTD